MDKMGAQKNKDYIVLHAVLHQFDAGMPSEPIQEQEAVDPLLPLVSWCQRSCSNIKVVTPKPPFQCHPVGQEGAVFSKGYSVKLLHPVHHDDLV